MISTARTVSPSSNSHHHRNIQTKLPYDRNASETAFDSVTIDQKNDSEVIPSATIVQSHHMDKHMARLVMQNAYDNSLVPGRDNDLLLFDYSAYLGKPFVFDYAKALSEAVQQAKHDVIESNYNLDESVFAYTVQPSSEDPSASKQLFTAAGPMEPSALQLELFGGTDSGQAPRSEKLKRQPPIMFPTAATVGTLPIGLAFFEALREQNNRPYSQAFAVPSRTFAALYAATTTEKPSVEPTTVTAASVQPMDSLYQVRETLESVDNYAADVEPEFEFNTSQNHSSRQFVAPYDASGLTKITMQSYQSQNEVHSPNDENYEIRVIKTFSSKPTSEHSSRVKLLHENKVTTEKPRAFERKKIAYVQRQKLNSQTTPAPSSGTERRRAQKKSRYVFNGEYYHPDASRKLHIVVPMAEQPTQMLVRVRRQLKSNERPQIYDSYRPQQYQLFKDDVELIGKKPTRSRKPARNPVRPTLIPGSTSAPPVELRYFQ